MRVLSIKNVTKLALTLTLIFTASSCGMYRLRKKPIVIDKTSKLPVLQTRSTRFLTCIKDLNRDGFRQSLIKDLCGATFELID